MWSCCIYEQLSEQSAYKTCPNQLHLTQTKFLKYIITLCQRYALSEASLKCAQNSTEQKHTTGCAGTFQCTE